MVLRLPRLSSNVNITGALREPTLAFVRWWDEVASEIEDTITDLTAAIARILVLETETPIMTQRSVIAFHLEDGDYGDITVSSLGAVWGIDNDAVTYAKMQNVSAASRLLGRGSASGAGDPEELTVGTGLSIVATALTLDAELVAIAGLTSAADRLPYFTGSETAALATFTAAGRALVDDADAAAQRTTLGLGTAATYNVGTSGATVPLFDGSAGTWTNAQTFPQVNIDANFFLYKETFGPNLNFDSGDFYYYDRTGNVFYWYIGNAEVAQQSSSVGFRSKKCIASESLTVATLPAAGTAGAGARAFVTDSNATLAAGLGNIVAAGGTDNVPLYSDGTNWRIG